MAKKKEEKDTWFAADDHILYLVSAMFKMFSL